jgi:hypothetical protein
MAQTRTSSHPKAKKNVPSEPRVREIVDEMLRAAFRDHSRDLETVLNDIDRRLRQLAEKR